MSCGIASDIENQEGEGSWSGSEKNEAKVRHGGEKIKVRSDAGASFYLKIDLLMRNQNPGILTADVCLKTRLSYG